MRKFHFDAAAGHLTLLDTLEVLELNQSASRIVELKIAGLPQGKISSQIATEFDVPVTQAGEDVRETLDILDSAGVSFSGKSTSWSPKTAIVHIIKNCNSACSMCDCWQEKKSILNSRAALYPYFQKLAQFGADSIMISGGEPLLHPELREILEDLKQIGLKRMLNTNGIILNRHGYLAEMGLEQLVSSMDGVTNESYRRYRGANAFSVVWKNLSQFKMQSPATRVGIRTTLNRDTYNQISVLFDQMNEFNVDDIGFSPADVASLSFGRSDNSASHQQRLMDLLIPSEDELLQRLDELDENHKDMLLLDKMFSEGRSQWDGKAYVNCLKYYLAMRRGEESQFSDEACAFPRVAMVLDYGGELRNCFYSDPFGSLNDFEKIEWNFEKNMKALKDSKKCQTCRGKVFCGVENL